MAWLAWACGRCRKRAWALLHLVGPIAALWPLLAAATGYAAWTGTNPSYQLAAAASGEPAGLVQGPATHVVGTRPVTWKELRQPCNGSELISKVSCHGPNCAKLFPGGTASPPPASPAPPAVIVQSMAGSAAAAAAAAGDAGTDAVEVGAKQQAEAQQVVAAGESAAAPADGAASPPEPSEGPQPSTGPATSDQPQEQSGAATPALALAPPAPGITSAPPPPSADRQPVPYCQCQQLCRAAKSGRDPNTSCRADSQQPNIWFIVLRGLDRVVCKNPLMPEVQAQKPNKGRPPKGG